MQDAPDPTQDGPQDSGPGAEQARPGNNLPLALTSFVGREREMAEANRLLDTDRLLTLSGPGGSGKTRLALAVASEVVGRFEDGVWLVELAPLSDPDLVPQAVASVLGIQETPGGPIVETLVNHLGPRKTLLVLDNCEHLIETSASLAEALLRRCPGLSILVTSREALGVAGETLLAVPPLSLPDPHHLPAIESLPRYEASRLFVERARAVRPDFSLTRQNALAVAQTCYRLDGMPLAIELAAARVRMLSVEQISSCLDDSFRLLTGSGRSALPRHRTLRATMDWSYDLLTKEEQTLLETLSVFAGGFTLEAAEEVCSGESIQEELVSYGRVSNPPLLDLLASLVDKSLVLVAEQDDAARYRLLETVRQYGQEKLDASGTAEAVRERHAGFYLALAEEPEPDLREQGAWLLRLGTEHDNFRAALRWTLQPEASPETTQLGLRLATALGRRRFWAAYGLSEGLGWLEKGLDKGSAAPRPLRAEALGYAGWIANVQGDYAKAYGLLEENYAVSKHLGDRRIVAGSLIQLGHFLTMHGSEHERVETLRGETEALLPELSDRQLIAPLLIFLGLAALNNNDYRQTAALLEEGLYLYREMGDAYGIAMCCGTLGFVALHEGDVDRAADMFEEALVSLRELRDRVGMFHCFMGSASVNSSRGVPDRAARLWGAAEALGEAAAVPLLPAIDSLYDYEGHVTAARSRLGEEAFEAAWAKGRKMTPEQTVEYALEEPEAPTQAEAPPDYPAGLSAREVEVLRLLANGMTNAQIAQELYISPRTVNAHLGSVYHKIGSSTRAEATRFASEHGLL
jgi:predicted ATPase/DNA-binding CsgD family transcriptional regulator